MSADCMPRALEGPRRAPPQDHGGRMTRPPLFWLVIVQLMQLELVPLELRDACAFVDQRHRHHDPPRGHKFSVAVADCTGEVRGVAIVWRPTARS